MQLVLFHNSEIWLGGKKLLSNNSAFAPVNDNFAGLETGCFSDGIKKLETCWKEYLDKIICFACFLKKNLNDTRICANSSQLRILKIGKTAEFLTRMGGLVSSRSPLQKCVFPHTIPSYVST